MLFFSLWRFGIVVLFLFHYVNGHLNWEPSNPAIDNFFYENALDSKLCEQQLQIINSNSMLRLQFIDAGIRLPKGILQGNTFDFGNYHQCLQINHPIGESDLQGKYCRIRFPLSQNVTLPFLAELLEMPDFKINAYNKINKEINRNLQQYDQALTGLKSLTGIINNNTRLMPGSPLGNMVLRLAVCIPKSCTTRQGISSLIFNTSAIGLEYQDEFCRLPDDKPWVPGDYIAIAIFSVIGLLSFLSTLYDLIYTFVFKGDKKQINELLKIFSIYSNGRRLMYFSSNSDSLNCLDGIRALSMIWVLIGHALTSESFWANPLNAFQWMRSLEALWITTAHIAVDTFFLLSGLLVVYATAGKFSSKKLLSNLHLFYLNRLLRMFPVLATGVLLEATIFHKVSDGPNWTTMTDLANRCRAFWWTTLLHIQNYASPKNTCIGQSWYLAIDVQLHILSPIVLVWVLSGSRRNAWVALSAIFVAQLAASTAYNFVMEFPSGMMSANPDLLLTECLVYGWFINMNNLDFFLSSFLFALVSEFVQLASDLASRGSEIMYYMVYYYMNTLTRASPFLVGMIYGYILHIYRGRKIRMQQGQVAACWACAIILGSFVIYSSYPIMQPAWDSQLLDSLYNSFIRPMWAVALGWLIFACVHGYGGPINWLLSLKIWKLPARLSYAMYILHYGLMVVVNSSNINPMHFSVTGLMFKFLAHFALVFIVSFVVVLFIDAPCSVIFKKILTRVPKKQHVAVENGGVKETNKEI